MVIHECGNAFVHDQGQSHCPWCHAELEVNDIRGNRIDKLKIRIPGIGAKYGLTLTEGKTIVLGRSNLGGHATTVSEHHLELTPMGNKVFLHHIGRHPTAILKDGTWYNLRSDWIDLDDIKASPLSLRLADLDINIGT